MQEDLAGAEERLRSAKIAAALAEHVAKVAGVVVEMREGGASEHAIAVYEAEQVVEEAKMGTAEVRKCPTSQVQARSRRQTPRRSPTGTSPPDDRMSEPRQAPEGVTKRLDFEPEPEPEAPSAPERSMPAVRTVARFLTFRQGGF